MHIKKKKKNNFFLLCRKPFIHFLCLFDVKTENKNFLLINCGKQSKKFSDL